MGWKYDEDRGGWVKQDEGEEDNGLRIGGLDGSHLDFDTPPRTTIVYDKYGYPLIPGTHDIDWDQFEREHPDGRK